MRLCVVSADSSFVHAVRERCEPAMEIMAVRPHEIDDESLTKRREVEVVEALSATHALVVRWDLLDASWLAALQARVSWIRIPILAVCDGNGADQAAALAAGADAIVHPPVHPSMLKAHVLAYRRTMESAQRPVMLWDRGGGSETAPEVRPGGHSDEVDHPPLIIDRDTYRVELAGNELALSPREFELLDFLARHEGEVVTRDQIWEAVWDMDFEPGTNTLDVYIHYLRRILSEQGYSGAIETVRGVGYRFQLS